MSVILPSNQIDNLLYSPGDVVYGLDILQGVLKGHTDSCPATIVLGCHKEFHQHLVLIGKHIMAFRLSGLGPVVGFSGDIGTRNRDIRGFRLFVRIVRCRPGARTQ